MEDGRKVNIGNLFDYLQKIAEGLESIVRWEAREKIAGQSTRENDLQHTFKTVFLTIMCAVMENIRRENKDKLDVGMLAAMALVHDVAETVEGDQPHFVKVQQWAKSQMAEFAAFQKIADPLPEAVREFYIQAFRRTITKSPIFIDDKEARFFNAVEHLGSFKRALHECRQGNLHFAPKLLEWDVEALESHSKEFLSLREWYGPYVKEAEDYLRGFYSQKEKYIDEFVKRGGVRGDFPF